jgi:hypothetical protein
MIVLSQVNICNDEFGARVSDSTIRWILGDVLSPRDTRNGLKERDARSGCFGAVGDNIELGKAWPKQKSRQELSSSHFVLVPVHANNLPPSSAAECVRS